MSVIIAGMAVVILYNVVAQREHPGLQKIVRVFVIPITVIVLCCIYLVRSAQMQGRLRDL